MQDTCTAQRASRFGFNTNGGVTVLPRYDNDRNVTVIAAMDSQGGIGINNSMPWHVPPDMKQFKRLTAGNVVIVGRKTYESFGSKPLPNRTNIVVTRDLSLIEQIDMSNSDNSVMGAISLEYALQLAGDKQIFIIGGGQIYQEALEKNLVDDMILTRFYKKASTDVKFPDFDASRFLPPAFSTHWHIKLRFRYEYWRRIQPEENAPRDLSDAYQKFPYGNAITA